MLFILGLIMGILLVQLFILLDRRLYAKGINMVEKMDEFADGFGKRKKKKNKGAADFISPRPLKIREEEEQGKQYVKKLLKTSKKEL